MPALALVDEVLTFVFGHLAYWIIPLGLLGEFVYLFRPERRQKIWMTGWGEATRSERPVLFYFLWLLHITVTVFFILLFTGYLQHLLRTREGGI